MGAIAFGFDRVGDHVIITDENANILYANKAVEQVTGFAGQEIIGKNPGDLWGGQMGKDFYEKMWHTIKDEKNFFVGEVQNKRKDGTMYWQELHISPILDPAGNIRFFIGIEPNITDRKEKEKFRDEFISIVGHQLRNPLTTMHLLISLLAKSGAMPEEDRKHLEEMSRQNENLSRFVGDLLMLSRVASGKLAMEPFDVKAETAALVAEVKAHHPETDISFGANGSGFMVLAVKSLAVQVFSNLIYNAAEYSAGKVDLLLEADDEAVLFSCHNNGKEILEEDKPKIFSKFFRSDFALAVKKSGTGIGLYLAKAIADSFGWDIWFDSEKSKGTTFYVKIPKK